MLSTEKSTGITLSARRDQAAGNKMYFTVSTLIEKHRGSKDTSKRFSKHIRGTFKVQKSSSWVSCEHRINQVFRSWMPGESSEGVYTFTIVGSNFLFPKDIFDKQLLLSIGDLHPRFISPSKAVRFFVKRCQYSSVHIKMVQTQTCFATLLGRVLTHCHVWSAENIFVSDQGAADIEFISVFSTFSCVFDEIILIVVDEGAQVVFFVLIKRNTGQWLKVCVE